MQNKAKEFIINNRIKEQQERDRELIKLGFYEVEYPTENVYSNEYPEMLDGIYYKKVPCEVTDDEYNEILRLHSTKRRSNKIALLLECFAYLIYVGGFLIGTISASQAFGYGDFSIAVAFSSWMTFFIFGTLILGFAEIIKLLDKISKK